MFLRDLALISPCKVAVTDDLFAVDVEAIHSVGSRQDEPSDEIVRAAELEAIRPPDGDVCALAWRELADVIATKYRRAAPCAEPQGLADIHCLRAATGARDEQGLLDLDEEVAALVRGRPVDTESDPYICIEQLAHPRDSRPESHVGGGAMRDAHALRTERLDVVVREMHAVRAPHIACEPADLLEILDGRAAVEVAAVVLLFDRLGEVRVQPQSELTGQVRRLRHQLPGDGERRAGSNG